MNRNLYSYAGSPYGITEPNVIHNRYTPERYRTANGYHRDDFYGGDPNHTMQTFQGMQQPHSPQGGMQVTPTHISQPVYWYELEVFTYPDLVPVGVQPVRSPNNFPVQTQNAPYQYNRYQSNMFHGNAHQNDQHTNSNMYDYPKRQTLQGPTRPALQGPDSSYAGEVYFSRPERARSVPSYWGH